jgi:tetrahydromethanopterin S-methyltransferase subunit H
MFEIDRSQQIFHIGKVHLGGQPGELPTVLIGSIFYKRHKIVENAQTGIFDEGKAEKLINMQEELSEKTGNPHMVDIVGLTPEAIRRYIDFVADITEAPILVDSTSADVKIAGIKYAKEVGLLERVIYNSITYHVKDIEVKELKETDVDSAVIMAYNPRNPWPEGRINLLRGDSSRKGLLDVSKNAGIEKILVDTAILDVPSIGLAAEAAYLVKKEFGLPSGGGPLNAVLEWKRVKELGNSAETVCSASAAVAMQYAGADFIFYGPIARAGIICPAVAMIDGIIAYAARRHNTKIKTNTHPLFKIF